MSRLQIAIVLLVGMAMLHAAQAQQRRLDLRPEMLVNEAEVGWPERLIDEQDDIVGPPVGAPETGWEIPSNLWKTIFPCSIHFDLGSERNLSSLWLFDTNGTGDVVISAGQPGDWQEVATYDCGKYLAWAEIPLQVSTRYLRLTKMSGSANFTEIALYEYSAKGWAARQQQLAAAAKAEAERQAVLARAREEMAKRPLVDLGEPFGRMALVDEIDCGAAEQTHRFVESPAGASELQTILGRPCRVLRKTVGEGAYISYRLGEMKLLVPGQPYVLVVDYPEDVPRSLIVMNAGNETYRGFHTGRTVGDALHPKYVNNNNESVDTPLSGRLESWQMLFWLHDRFPDREFLRGDKERELAPEDGFAVNIAQFSANNIPASHGAAVYRIRLFAFPEERDLTMPTTLPPDDLPHRHIFWREEMADGVIGSAKNERRGIAQPLDWYRHKASLMHFLAINTFSKDLLEFGACQHWDSTPHGGNQWVYFNAEHKDLWGQIVELMGSEGFNVFPYYEYSGSKGQKGLGPQRRCRPLTRDDAYTHIKWIESANADITDPDTYEDFQKMLELTIVQHKDKANFVGAWLRPRSQIPISFGAAALQRFAADTLREPITRKHLIDDQALLGEYYDWWYGKRRDFLAAMRDYLRAQGVNDQALVLYTADAGEPGTSFPTWAPRLVTDDPAFWGPLLREPLFMRGDQPIEPLPLAEVVAKDLYLEALLAAPLSWGGWENHHASPPPDPHRYQEIPAVLMSHCFNRVYTVSSPRTFDAFRTPTGLAIVRHYTLNENMMFGLNDEAKLGYFVVDVEKAGPFCMQAEALAMANGDPTMIGYLSGGNYSRGFPQYVRSFNANFLALPALPSRVLADAAADPEVVVRAIATERHGTYLAVVNTGSTAKAEVAIKLPAGGQLVAAVGGQPLPSQGGTVRLALHPCQLLALRLLPDEG